MVLDSDNVVATGASDSLDGYLPPDALFPWDVVETCSGEPVTTGVIDGWYDDEGTTRYCVWIEAEAEMRVYAGRDLKKVGRSLTRASGPTRSVKVSVHGEMTGVDD